MQRQIKFRIWDKELKEFTDFTESYADHLECIYLDPRGGFLLVQVGAGIKILDENRFVIQQFTGLLDANKKDIYEGDIVKTDPEHFTAKLQTRRESEEYAEYTKGRVTWWNEGFAICQENIGATRISEYASCHCCPCGLEVIGNIFENPELLSAV